MFAESDKAEQPKILVVDDDQTLLAILTSVLAASGFPVSAAGNVEDALRVINSEPIDVLLCDLHIPEASDCLAVVEAMREMSPVAVVIVLTGYAELDEELRGQLNADGILVKPTPIPDLLAKIRKEWSKRRAA